MTNRSIPFRTHYLSLAVCKHIFLHPTHGLVFAQDAIRCSEAENYKLLPLLLYALSIPDTAIRRLTFSPLDQPRALYGTLTRLWSQEAESFRGLPDGVMVSRQVAAACPALAGHLASDGVELIVADKGDKVTGAALRSAQQDSLRLGFPTYRNQRINTIDRLDDAASSLHRFDSRNHTGSDRQRQEQWAALPCRPMQTPTGGFAMDWVPGSWLSSWEVNLPATSRPRYFESDAKCQRMLLFTGSGNDSLQNDIEEDDEEVANQGWAVDDDPDLMELAKDMVICWPNSATEIARSIGISGRDLRWFLDGKAGLDERILAALLSVLGIKWGEHDCYDAPGPCVVVAKNLGAATRIYDRLSHGGDVSFSYEAVPESGQPDPNWCYLLFGRSFDSSNIMMFERGSKAADCLNGKIFMNFEGMRSVSNRL